MKKIISLCCILCGFLAISAQITGTSFSECLPMEGILSPADEAMLRACPTLKLDAVQRARELPGAVNNAHTPYMSPIYGQSALECGQASSIVYTFSYEVNRRRHLENNGNARRYPSHFAWNFCNGGTNRGVSFMDTWEVIRTAGTPNTAQWGGSYNAGGNTRWHSGYDLYYQAMQNRIVEFLAIPTDTEEGILTLKHWLHNHLCGDETGGLANFYSTHVPQGHDMQHFLPDGTPCAGMYVVPAFQSNVNHAQTIVGYNDSICWDYNGDGLYTNHLDLNGDGIVDVRDWEVGGFIFCNSFGTGFSDGGYCFMPYRTLAELPAEGGIWNKCVYVVNVKDVVKPRLTYKATIRHTCRGKLKVTAGVANNTSATEPEHTLEFGVFNFQGGEWYMRGDSTEEGKTLEFGLDVSELLQFISPNQPAKFFLQVTEDDPDGTSDGAIVAFSLMDYPGNNPTEIACPQSNVPIANNSTTRLSVVAGIDFSRPQMQPNPPVMTAFHDYHYQIPATGGRAPYRFEFTKEYDIEEFPAPYPTIGGSSISLPNSDEGHKVIDLPFDFPYYDNSYRQLCIYADGYMSFRYDTYNWPFLQNQKQQVKTTQMIAPFRTDLVVSSLKVQQSSQEVAIAVTAKIDGQAANSVNYVVKLFPDGTIEFYYGNMSYSGDEFLSLLSRGDARIYQETAVSGRPANEVSNRNFRFIPPATVDFLTLSEEGVLSGTATESFVGVPVAITCFDNNDLRHDTTILISAEYDNLLTISEIYSESSGNNIVHAGEDVWVTLVVENMDSLPYNNCIITMNRISDYVEMTDNEEFFGYIAPNNAYRLRNAFAFHVDENTPNGTILEFAINIGTDRMPVTSLASFTVSSYRINLTDYAISDDNNRKIDPSETCQLQLLFANPDDEPVEDVSFVLRPLCSGITALAPSINLGTLPAREAREFGFGIQSSASFDPNQVVDFAIDILVGGVPYETKSISFVNCTNCEDFGGEPLSDPEEAGMAWFATGDDFFTGPISMRSGIISHNDTSAMTRHATVVRDGFVSFNFKTSTENNYDWLYFYIDGQQQSRWSGLNDWTNVRYPIAAGEHDLTWTYIKDYSVDGNLDCVWVDDICLPLDNDATPTLRIAPANVSATVNNAVATIPLLYEAMTPIHLLFENQILDNQNRQVGWASIEYLNGSVNALETRELALTIDTRRLPAGVYRATLTAVVEEGNTIVVPIEITTDGVGITHWETSDYSAIIYPNPTTSAICIEMDERASFPILYHIINMTGKTLLSGQIAENRAIIDLGGLPPGLYFLQMLADGKCRQVFKVIKR